MSGFFVAGEKALGPIIEAAGLGGVNQLEGLAAIRRRPLLIQVDGDSRHVRRPTRVDEQTRIVEWPRRGVDHFAADPAVFGRSRGGGRREGLLAKFKEGVLAGEALPTLTGNPRRIDAPCGATP